MEPYIPFTAAQVRRHRFCFCVPVRWGVWILSAVEAVVSAMLCIANFLALFSTHDGRPWLIGIRVAGVLGWGSCVVMCGFGWIGTIEQKRKWVRFPRTVEFKETLTLADVQVEWYYLLCWVSGTKYLRDHPHSTQARANAVACLRYRHIWLHQSAPPQPPGCADRRARSLVSQAHERAQPS